MQNPGDSLRSPKRLGQVFLLNEAVAKAEAAHAYNKRVLEIGPGRGMLTKELCRTASSVTAVEVDKRLYTQLKLTLRQDNLRLINADFFSLSDEELGLSGIEILISNIPYALSSKTIGWIISRGKEAVLCMQREFVEHMLAKAGTPSYSKLSVISSLSLSITEIMPVPKSSFYPVPKVDSTVIYLKPRELRLSESEKQALSCLMQHKKKRLKNAIEDARLSLGLGREAAHKLAAQLPECEERVFRISPEGLLAISSRILKKRSADFLLP